MQIEKGKVWFPSQAPWLESLMKELLAFPNGKHDDQVDSISQMPFGRDMALVFARTRGNLNRPKSGGTGHGLGGSPVTSRLYSIPTAPMPDLW